MPRTSQCVATKFRRDERNIWKLLKLLCRAGQGGEGEPRVERGGRQGSVLLPPRLHALRRQGGQLPGLQQVVHQGSQSILSWKLYTKAHPNTRWYQLM